MPCLNITTNASLEGFDTSTFLLETTETVATIMGKPKDYIMVVLKGSVPIACSGTEHPAAYAELVSVGGLDRETNHKLSAALADIFEKKLNVEKKRLYLKFFDCEGHKFGFNGTLLG